MYTNMYFLYVYVMCKYNCEEDQDSPFFRCRSNHENASSIEAYHSVVTQVSAGADHTVAITAAGEVYRSVCLIVFVSTILAHFTVQIETHLKYFHWDNFFSPRNNDAYFDSFCFETMNNDQ